MKTSLIGLQHSLYMLCANILYALATLSVRRLDCLHIHLRRRLHRHIALLGLQTRILVRLLVGYALLATRFSFLYETKALEHVFIF